jgi:hypothetical protein
MKERDQYKRGNLAVMRPGLHGPDAGTTGSGSPARIAWPLIDLAKATGMSVAFWKKIIAKGDIPATKGGNRTLILDEDLREWLMKNRKVRGEAA